jgi:hypothetical protein
MGWADAHGEAMVAAAETLEELELDAAERIDVFEALAQAGLKLLFRPLEGVAGFYEPARGAARPGVLINAGHPLALQRYSAAHELGHHVFGHGRRIDHDAEPASTARGPEERRAEAFAAWFLMPPEAVQTALCRLGMERPVGPLDAYALALRLGTSYKAMCTHLPSLKLGASAVWRDLPLKALKEHLSPTPPPGGWKQDIWGLTEADAQAPVVARAGDRLLLDLPGWDLAELPDGLRAEEVPAADLLSTARWCVDLPPHAAPGPVTIQLSGAGRSASFTVVVERPRHGRFFPEPAVAR